MKFLKFWFPLFLYSVIIFLLSDLPNLKAPAIGQVSFDFIFHIMEYVPMGFLFIRALNQHVRGMSLRLVVAASLVFCVVYGLIDEIHQLSIIGRSFSWTDIAMDGIGGITGGWIYQKLILKT